MNSELIFFEKSALGTETVQSCKTHYFFSKTIKYLLCTTAVELSSACNFRTLLKASLHALLIYYFMVYIHIVPHSFFYRFNFLSDIVLVDFFKVIFFWIFFRISFLSDTVLADFFNVIFFWYFLLLFW